MTSVKNISKTAASPARAQAVSPPVAVNDHLTEAIELLFFGYRDFISDPDAILSAFEFGRAHHRVVHFVGRHPGITVAELLDILRITKQSLARVLRQLIERRFVEQKTGEKDRRQRRLYLTPEGAELLRRLVAPQRDRVRKALDAAGPGAEDAWRKVMLALLNEENRPEVEHLITRDGK